MAFKMKRSPLKKGENIFLNIFKKASPEKMEARKRLKQRAKKSGVSTFEQQKLDKIAARRAKSKADKLKSKSSSTMPDPKNEIKVPGANKPSWQWDDVTKNVKVTPKVKEVVNKKDVVKKKKVVEEYGIWNVHEGNDPVRQRHNRKFKKNIAPEEWKMKRRGQILKDYGVDLDYKNKKVKKKEDKKKKFTGYKPGLFQGGKI